MSFRRKKKVRHIPDIAKRVIDPQYTQDSKDSKDSNEPTPSGKLTGDFIRLQKIKPPKLPGDNDHPVISVGTTSKLELLIRQKTVRPTSVRRHVDDNKKSVVMSKELRQEIEKEALKQQDKTLNDSLTRPLINKGIKINNFKTVYPK